MVAAPCDWGFTVEDCCAFDGLTEERQQDVLAMATEFLWNWTERMYGICEVSVRPCRRNCTRGSTFWGSGPSWNGGKMLPTLIAGQWYNITCGTCNSDDCSCPSLSTLVLPGPIESITEIWIDGVLLPTTSYMVQNGRYLVRTDGWAWPTCQNMTMDPRTDPETFEIVYRRGVPVPSGGLVAASILACQFAKAIATPKDCSLPERIKDITRDGVTVTLMDDFKELEGGKTGIWLIDSWVASVMQPNRSSTVRSVDIPRGRFRTTT